MSQDEHAEDIDAKAHDQAGWDESSRYVESNPPSTVFVTSQDEYAQDLTAKENANAHQTGLSIPGSGQPIDRGYAPPLNDVTGALNPSAIDAGLPPTPSLSLWIRGPVSWSQYARIPKSTSSQLLVAYAGGYKGSPGKLHELYSSSPYTRVDPIIYAEGNYKMADYKTTDYVFNEYTLIPFSRDVEGFYYLMCTINDEYGNVILSSNIATIEVI
jgi:hypothetical protein